MSFIFMFHIKESKLGNDLSKELATMRPQFDSCEWANAQRKTATKVDEGEKSAAVQLEHLY